MFLWTLWILFGIYDCVVVTALSCGFLNITRQTNIGILGIYIYISLWNKRNICCVTGSVLSENIQRSSKVIPQGVPPTPCIPCCLVVTDRELLTCHQDCQTSFFRSLGGAELSDISSVSLEDDKEYCVVEFASDRAQFLPPWVLYFSGCEERDRLLEALESVWRDIFQVCLPRRRVSEPLVQKRCGDALALMRSAWQRSDSLARGRAQREPWC